MCLLLAVDLPVPWGALVNAGAVLLGGSIGLLLHRSLPERLRRIAFTAVGLCTLLIGMQMALQSTNLLPVIFSMILGGVAGEALDLHGRFEACGDWLKARLRIGPVGASTQAVAAVDRSKDFSASKPGLVLPDPDQQDAHSAAGETGSEPRFSEGLLTAILIFCVGSMTIVGSLKEGISGDASLIYAKSLLDGFTSIALASTYGVGVLFSILPLLAVQFALTWLGAAAGSSVDQQTVSQLTAVGGLLILALGINLLELKVIKVSNLLPALLVIVLLESLLRWLGH